MPASGDKKPILPLILYYLTLLGMVAAASWPSPWNWGLATFAWVPDLTRWILWGIALLWPAAAFLLERRIRPGPPRPSSAAAYWGVAAAVTLVLAAVFVIARTRAHYLGDGYVVLSSLASDHPILKLRALGETTLHNWVKAIFGGGEAGAEWSFRSLSVLSGIIYSLAVFAFARRLFEDRGPQFLFAAALLTAGFTLLFLGYVEYYSLFVMAVAVFLLAGLAALGDRGRPFVAALLILPTTVLHVLGSVMLPAAIYLGLAAGPLKKRTASISPKLKMLLSLVAIGLFVGTVVYLYRTSLFVRLAVLPLAGGRFTIHGYTMLSAGHLADIANLLLLLMPGLLLCLPLLVGSIRRIDSRRRWFLALAAAGGLATLLLFDPKLGMPRDWDLFAFATVPTILGCHYVLVRRGSRAVLTVLLAVGLAAVTLAGRAAILLDEEDAFRQFYSYIQWEPQKNRNAMAMAVQRIQDRGNVTRGAALFSEWNEKNPEWILNRKGMDRLDADDSYGALQFFRQAVEANPVFPAAYSNVGLAYFQLGQNDSALVYLEIARAMNPYHPRVAYVYGLALLRADRVDEAEEAFRQSLDVAPTGWRPYLGLSHVANKRGNTDLAWEYKARAAEMGETPLGQLRELGEYYLEKGSLERARKFFSLAIDKGLDSAYVEDLNSRHPELQLQ